MAPHPTQNKVAPWKKQFEEELEKIGGPAAEFILATVTNKGQPRLRYCIHRGFWSVLAKNDHNKLPKNPATYESDCPTFTTDARMSKVFDIFATGKGKGDLEQSRSGTGGGGPVEAIYWIKETKQQWRIKGKCWLLASDDIEGGEEAQNSGTITAKSEVGRYMRTKGDDDEENPSKNDEWSWKLEVENMFENLSPLMRGSFKNPPPGMPKSEGTGEDGYKMGQEGGHLSEDDLARKNFRVAIITPEEVELTDLSDAPNQWRKQWTLSKAAGGPGGSDQAESVGEWNEVETWP